MDEVVNQFHIYKLVFLQFWTYKELNIYETL
jgi:hypothetical protein